MVSLSFQLVLFLISFFSIYGPTYRPQNSKGHWLSHCTIKGASCAEFQHNLVNYFYLFFALFLPSYLFISSVLSTPFLVLYILHIFVLSFFLVLFPCFFLWLFVFHSCLFLLLCFPFMIHFILSSLLRPHQFCFNLYQFYLCFHPFVAFCKSKRRFLSHAVMRRASWINLNVVKFSIQLTVTCNRISTFQWIKLLRLL